ncbi:MAG TPA: DUF488 domain-containing protein [Longimicrobiales bacterium]|nr:DUF488 domain-containing protein [Longimicrobiales bacterium]
MTIFTVGHSTRSEDEFLGILRAHGIRRLIDVRRYPGSRRHPHFSRESLQRTLPAQGIAYEHAPALGGRRTPAPDSVNDAWRSASFRAYADHLATQEFRDALENVIAGAADVPTAVMCAEAVPWRCHRQLIADVLVARGYQVENILSAERADPHRLNAHARVGLDGSVTYPAAPEDDEQASLF